MNGSNILAYTRTLKSRMDNFYTQVGDIGKDQVANKSGYTEGGEIQVYTKKKVNGIGLVAHGRGVCMVEFGAGLSTDPSHPYASVINMGFVTPGGYSRSEGSGEFAKYGRWYFAGKIYKRIRSRRGMYKAAMKMKQKIPSIAKKVFKA